MKKPTEIQWSQAQELAKQEKIKKETRAAKYEKRVAKAKDAFYDRLGNEDFGSRDFDEILSDFDIDGDDLFYALI
jgi:hypothetical protein